MMDRAIQRNVQSPFKITKALLDFLPALMGGSNTSEIPSTAEDKDRQRKSGIPTTRFNAPVSPHKIFEAVDFALDDFKKIRKLVEGATINDVVLAVVSGAMRRYLKKHNELPTESLSAISPINARTGKNDNDAPGNDITAMTVRLSTDIDDPVKRIAQICKTTQQTKAGKSGIGSRMLVDVIKHIPAPGMSGVVKMITGERFAPKMTNLYVSNVPGTQHPLYLKGSLITNQYGMAPIGNGMGLFIATPSYNGRMSFCVVSDRKIMPDISDFRKYLKDSFAEYLKLSKSQS